jgi:hypothetical protein
VHHQSAEVLREPIDLVLEELPQLAEGGGGGS